MPALATLAPASALRERPKSAMATSSGRPLLPPPFSRMLSGFKSRCVTPAGERVSGG
jgi:ribosomal protein L34